MFSQDWDAKPRRGRQRKVWSRLVDDLFGSLDLDKAEWLDEIEKGDSSLKVWWRRALVRGKERSL